MHELPSRALQLDQRLGASPFALQGLLGVDGNGCLRRHELEPAELLRAQPARPAPVQADEANESLPGAHGKEDARLNAGQLGTPASPVGKLRVTLRIGDVHHHARV